MNLKFSPTIKVGVWCYHCQVNDKDENLSTEQLKRSDRVNTNLSITTITLKSKTNMIQVGSYRSLWCNYWTLTVPNDKLNFRKTTYPWHWPAEAPELQLPWDTCMVIRNPSVSLSIQNVSGLGQNVPVLQFCLIIWTSPTDQDPFFFCCAVDSAVMCISPTENTSQQFPSKYSTAMHNVW